MNGMSSGHSSRYFCGSNRLLSDKKIETATALGFDCHVAVFATVLPTHYPISGELGDSQLSYRVQDNVKNI